MESCAAVSDNSEPLHRWAGPFVRLKSIDAWVLSATFCVANALVWPVTRLLSDDTGTASFLSEVPWVVLMTATVILTTIWCSRPMFDRAFLIYRDHLVSGGVFLSTVTCPLEDILQVRVHRDENNRVLFVTVEPRRGKLLSIGNHFPLDDVLTVLRETLPSTVTWTDVQFCVRRRHVDRWLLAALVLFCIWAYYAALRGN